MPIQFANNSVGTSPARIINTSTPFNFGIRIKADPANTDVIAFGFTGSPASAALTYHASAATDGYVLSPGDEVPVPVTVVADATNIWARSGTGTQRMQAYGE